MGLIDQLKQDEGLRLMPYLDTVGKLTIGYGRNLKDIGITLDEAEMLLSNDISRTRTKLANTFPWTGDLDEVRRGVLEAMAFNMGIAGLGQFHNFLAAVQAGDFETAADHMADSLWAKQVGARASRLELQMRSGQWVYATPI